MYYKFIVVILILSLPNFGKAIKIGDLVVTSIKVDFAKGFSFKNMTIMFNKGKNAKRFIMETFYDPKYNFSKCKPVEKTQDCIIINNSSFNTESFEKGNK